VSAVRVPGEKLVTTVLATNGGEGEIPKYTS
jgi:hypothetical protein